MITNEDYSDVLREKRKRLVAASMRKGKNWPDSGDAAIFEMPDRSNRQVSLAELSQRMRECPALRELADA